MQTRLIAFLAALGTLAGLTLSESAMAEVGLFPAKGNSALTAASENTQTGDALNDVIGPFIRPDLVLNIGKDGSIFYVSAEVFGAMGVIEPGIGSDQGKLFFRYSSEWAYQTTEHLRGDPERRGVVIQEILNRVLRVQVLRNSDRQTTGLRFDFDNGGKLTTLYHVEAASQELADRTVESLLKAQRANERGLEATP